MWTQMRFGVDQGIFGLVEKTPRPGQKQPLIVTLAGLGQAMSEKNYLFSNMRKRLAYEGRWVVQFDYRGYGDSYGELGQATLSTMLEDAQVVLKTVTASEQPSKLYLVGNALGAVIAKQLAVVWEEEHGIPSIPILISPPLKKLPPSSAVFPAEVLARLAQDGYVDSQLLVPGHDYYTLSDFCPNQYEYFTALGAHMLYLHGQCIGSGMIADLDRLDPPALFGQGNDICPLICGEHDDETARLARQMGRFRLYQLSGVTYYHQHPAAMDQLIGIVQSIVREDVTLC
ncbi:MAG: alpha/beta fold hydrolase [Brevibacillus sp.]|nr:alpha/beta fold hydrolase [Brevibacillus sp.]